MRHLMASITITASALLAVGGTALATDLHSGVPSLGIKSFSGQPGTNGGVSCQTLQASVGSAASPPGQVGAQNNSPFINTSKAYAGTSPQPINQ
jgi:hypothetical protein